MNRKKVDWREEGSREEGEKVFAHASCFIGGVHIHGCQSKDAPPCPAIEMR